jgi:hypothetical protein
MVKCHWENSLDQCLMLGFMELSLAKLLSRVYSVV